MPATYTTSLRFVKPANGDLSWGQTVNDGFTTLADNSIAGKSTITLASTSHTLSNNNGAADEARSMFLEITGTPGGAADIICPAVSKLYIISNTVTGGFAVTLKTAAGTGISVPNGKTMILRCDGTNVVDAITSFSSLAVTGAINAAGLTASQAIFTDANKNLVSNALTGTGNVVMSTSPTLVTPVLGVATATSINKVTITAPATSATLTIANGKTLTANNSLTFAGTDATTMTFPNTNQTLAGLSVAQTFSAAQTFSSTVTMSGTTTNIAIGTSQTTGTVTVGGTAQTGAIVIGRSTGTQTVSIANGATTTPSIKTVNIATGTTTGQSRITIGALNTDTITTFYGQTKVVMEDSYTLFPTQSFTLQNSPTGAATGTPIIAPMYVNLNYNNSGTYASYASAILYWQNSGASGDTFVSTFATNGNNIPLSQPTYAFELNSNSVFVGTNSPQYDGSISPGTTYLSARQYSVCIGAETWDISTKTITGVVGVYGDYSVNVGYRAGGVDVTNGQITHFYGANVLIGASAGYYVTSTTGQTISDYNVCIGVTAGYNALQGASGTGGRVLIGNAAGATSNCGARAICVGQGAGNAFAGTYDDVIIIGTNSGASIAANNSVIIGQLFNYNGTDTLTLNNNSGINVVSTGGISFVDSEFRVIDDADNTKVCQFQASGITTATTRTLTIPNASGTLALLSSTQTFSGTTTFSSTFTLSGTTQNISLGTSQTTGTWTAGGTAQTGALTLGQSTGAQTVNVASGATTNGTTKVVNVGTAGVSGSITNINIGSAVSGATGKTTIDSEWTQVNAFAAEPPITVNSATHTVAITTHSLIFTTTNCTVTLPTASSFTGRVLVFKNVTANSVDSNASNVVPLGSAVAGTAILAATAGKFAYLQSDGTNWIVMMAN